MKMAKKILSSLLAASMMLGMLSACGGGGSTAESATQGGTETATSSGNTLTVGMILRNLRDLPLACRLSMIPSCVWM